MSPLSCSDRVVPAADSSELKHENTASPLACFLYTVFPCPHPRGGMQGAQTIPTKLGGTVDTQGRAEGKELPSEVEGTREPRAGSAPPCAYRSMGQSLPSWVPQRIWDLEGPPLSPRPPRKGQPCRAFQCTAGPPASLKWASYPPHRCGRRPTRLPLSSHCHFRTGQISALRDHFSPLLRRKPGLACHGTKDSGIFNYF